MRTFEDKEDLARRCLLLHPESRFQWLVILGSPFVTFSLIRALLFFFFFLLLLLLLFLSLGNLHLKCYLLICVHI